jgi:hypothetical protein
MEQGSSSARAKMVRRTSEEIRSIITEYEKSGLSPKAFCKLHQLKKTYFSRWLSRYGNRKGPKGFVPVKLPGIAAEQENMLFAECRGIKFYQKVDPSYLKALLS